MLLAKIRRFAKGDAGAAMVEFALVGTIVFFPVVFGIVELGRSVFVKTTITAAAREGVRYAIVHGAESGAIADSTMVADYVKGRTPLNGIVVRPTWENPAKEWPQWVQVQVTYAYVPIVPVLRSRTITSTSRQIIQF